MKNQIIKTATMCITILSIITGCKMHNSAANNAAAAGDSANRVMLNSTINNDTAPINKPDSTRRDRTDTSHSKL